MKQRPEAMAMSQRGQQDNVYSLKGKVSQLNTYTVYSLKGKVSKLHSVYRLEGKVSKLHRYSLEGLTQVLADVLAEVRLSISRDISGADLLHNLLSAPWLRSLLRVYECLLQQKNAKCVLTPYLPYSSGLSQEVMANLREVTTPTPEILELYRLLEKPHVQALLLTHDTVAKKDYDPVLPPVPPDLPSDEEAMRIVCMVKNKQPLGATIKKDLKTKEILVARVIHGGLADRSGLLNPGDKLVEVNGRPMRGLEPEQVIQILTNSRGTIMFKVIPNLTQPDNQQATVFVRAMADYAPALDRTIPCPDAGMAFHKGELLEIVDQTDALWWQARKLDSSAACAGLIPSTNSLKKRLREVWFSEPPQGHTCIKPYDDDDLGVIDLKFDDTDEDAVETEEAENDYTRDGIYIAGFRRSIRLWRRRTQSKRRQSCHSCCPTNSHGSLANPYEEVVTFQRNPEDPPRLIALIGPSGVGVNELRKRIIKINPMKFQGAVPHTTRPLKRSEEAGREYHFISRELFEYMACNHRFLEYGEYKGHFYGTSVDAIKEVIDSGKVCVIDIEPHSIPSIRTKRLQPFIIFVRPPSLDRLRQTRRSAKIFTLYQMERSFRDEDFREMEQTSGRLETLYGHYFDRVLVNEDLRETCLQLFNLIQHAQEDQQWVPTAWTLPDEP
ncbi:MAGUK p55 subfamily member 4-like [Alosa pseudoharengus]|uniref:MAGUK p55 subfamily member 4-like n=1 Tax=Alosa pseudoharengus TaxID=34774 RepID=UPI003F8A3024